MQREGREELDRIKTHFEEEAKEYDDIIITQFIAQLNN